VLNESADAEGRKTGLTHEGAPPRETFEEVPTWSAATRRISFLLGWGTSVHYLTVYTAAFARERRGMARSIRVEYSGAFYHVMARGNRCEVIFMDEDDRRFFLHTLTQACERSGWHVHARVLMGNHSHLFIETPLGLSLRLRKRTGF